MEPSYLALTDAWDNLREAEMDRSERPPMSLRFPSGDSVLGLLVLAPTVAALAIEIRRAPSVNLVQLAAWTAMIAGVELLQVATWGGVKVSLGCPLFSDVALHSPHGLDAGV